MKGLIVENKQLVLRHDLSIPVPQKNEVLVKIMSATINQIDVEFIQGKYDWILKLSGGNYPTKTGIEFSGIIVEGGKNFQKGAYVFGYVHLTKGMKTHQEYISINPNYIALMPSNISFEEAAAMPLGALTSLVALTELGGIQHGKKVLINGAAGGLGVYAVQLANIFGALITATAGDNQRAFLESIGADEVVDYNVTPIEALTDKFDIILDLSNEKSFADIRSLLTKNGTFIPAEPNKHIMALIQSFYLAQKTKYLYVDKGDNKKLNKIVDWVASGKLIPVLDSVYDFKAYQQGFQRLSEQGRRGRIVLNIGKKSAIDMSINYKNIASDKL